ncbi:MAG: fasciclin domain-containing protein [Alphaproteobacteria bacterium]|nr:fasciclin domain-containing protein [Alphaproteobacteria bacterium]
MKTLQNARFITLFMVFAVMEASVASAFNVTGAAGPVTVGGAQMLPNKDVVENLSHSADHTTFVGAIKSAGLNWVLGGSGTFTVFAPTNDAFAHLPPGTLDDWMKSENKSRLHAIIAYHVVPQHLTLAEITDKASANGGIASYRTMEGETLTIMKDSHDRWWVADQSGTRAQIVIPDVTESNGVMHVIDAVLMPGN